MFFFDGELDYLAVTATTTNGLSTCCAAKTVYDPVRNLEVCEDCDSIVVAVVK